MRSGLVSPPGAWAGEMVISNPGRICLVPKVRGLGGMVSFREKLVQGLAARGIQVTYNLSETPYAAVLVIGGTRDLSGLWRAKRGGVRVIQRLDGINWIHRKAPTGLRHYVRAEYGNFILSFIRSRLADRIVYQSEFSRRWWERVYSKINTPWYVVHNGVDLERYSPLGLGSPPVDHIRILLVEGTIGSGYEAGLKVALQLGVWMVNAFHRRIELMVAGKISAAVQKIAYRTSGVQLAFLGQVPPDKIPEIDRSAHVLYAADLNPACPNSVIEALACSLPVAAFDTGALAEIVTSGSGLLVPYGGDPWKLESPDIPALAQAVNNILEDQETYRKAARHRAEEAFDLNRMVEGYLAALGVA